MIVGELPRFAAVSLGWHDDSRRRATIAAGDRRASRGTAGVLLLTDMFGGTPSNLGMTFLERDRVEVITGVNLPMLIKLASLRQSPNCWTVARQMREHGRNAIWVASDLMRPDAGSRPKVRDADVTSGHGRPNPLGLHARAAAQFRAARVAVHVARSGWRATGGRSTARASWDCCCWRRRAARRSRLRPRRRTNWRRSTPWRAGRARLR